MKKVLCILFLLIFTLQFTVISYGVEYNKQQIKHGMYEKIVNEQYGQPELSRDLDPGFLPIPRKRCLYKLDEGDYMVLQFYSGRVSSGPDFLVVRRWHLVWGEDEELLICGRNMDRMRIGGKSIVQLGFAHLEVLTEAIQ